MRTRIFVIDRLEICIERCRFSNYERLYINDQFIASKDTSYGSWYSFRFKEGKTLIPYRLNTGFWMNDIRLFRDGSRVVFNEEIPIVEARIFYDFELV